jgi:hypothetical protein
MEGTERFVVADLHLQGFCHLLDVDVVEALNGFFTKHGW